MRSKGVVLACVLASTVGCYKASFVIRDGNATRGPERDKWTHFFLFGLVGEESIDVRDFCPRGRVVEVQTGGNFGTGFISYATLGIYTPRKVYVTCAADQGPRANHVSFAEVPP